MLKRTAKKIRRLHDGHVLAGFAGSTADAFTLFEKFEAKLSEFRGNLRRAAVELAKDWRTDRVLRRLEALMVVTDGKDLMLLSGTGDVVEPDDGVIGIGSGGSFALAAARALLLHTDLPAGEIAREAVRIASEICVFTNGNIVSEEIAVAMTRAEPEDGGTRPLIPREIVAELDRYIVGQGEAKRAVAIALRNRWRRQQVPRGAAGRDRPEEHHHGRAPPASGRPRSRGGWRSWRRPPSSRWRRRSSPRWGTWGATSSRSSGTSSRSPSTWCAPRRWKRSRTRRRPTPRSASSTCCSRARRRRRARRRPEADGGTGGDAGAVPRHASRGEARRTAPSRSSSRRRRCRSSTCGTLGAAPRRGWTGTSRRCSRASSRSGRAGRRCGSPRRCGYFEQEEAARRVDMDRVKQLAVERTEQSGIVFLDEIDKIAGRESLQGPDVSRQGVQRDLLPIVEGSTVNTKHGVVRTDHILFVAAGAFHVNKPSDLIPELQGRFPIRVELSSLTRDDFVRILTEPHGALTRQYEAMLSTEGVRLSFDAGGRRADRRDGVRGERPDGEHRGAPPAHGDGAPARRAPVLGAGDLRAGGGRHPALRRGAARRGS